MSLIGSCEYFNLLPHPGVAVCVDVDQSEPSGQLSQSSQSWSWRRTWSETTTCTTSKRCFSNCRNKRNSTGNRTYWLLWSYMNDVLYSPFALLMQLLLPYHCARLYIPFYWSMHLNDVRSKPAVNKTNTLFPCYNSWHHFCYTAASSLA